MAGASLDIELTISNAAEVKAAFESLQARLADLTPAFRDIGEALLNSTRQRFEDSVAPDGTPWKALSEATLIGRARRASGGRLKNKDGRYSKKAAMGYAYAKPLIDRGNLMGLLNYQAGPKEVRIGTPLIYGATHQFGNPQKNIPARPFLGLSSSDEAELLDILNDHLSRAMQG
ncbi:MAG: phage virion morphogenesis protein [Candidatus Contendobacter sp.]|mgnify:CR=1 FL=1|jgi:phage virion morphogenesis protein|nr:phage virion morphogenesis protein [Gammaproteobacteria bacterium]MCC8993428.1 phage virion morphogenesis protein [Candidatus Contendobacter sp.]